MYINTVESGAISADFDQTPGSAADDVGLHCLPRSVCPNLRMSIVM